MCCILFVCLFHFIFIFFKNSWNKKKESLSTVFYLTRLVESQNDLVLSDSYIIVCSVTACIHIIIFYYSFNLHRWTYTISFLVWLRRNVSYYYFFFLLWITVLKIKIYNILLLGTKEVYYYIIAYMRCKY